MEKTKVILDLMEEFKFNEAGVITSPGKFEGEMIYVPYFWEASMNGAGDEGGNEAQGYWFGVVITPEDRENFPEHLNSEDYGIIMGESDSGFVYASVYDEQGYIQKVGELTMEDEEYAEEFGDEEY